MKTLKEYLDYKKIIKGDSIEEGSRNNGHKIAKEIIKAYFGGYIPDKLSDEGMKCATDDDMYKLIEKMENYYINQPDCDDPFDESDIDAIHNDLTKWVREHNK